MGVTAPEALPGRMAQAATHKLEEAPRAPGNTLAETSWVP